MEYAQGGFKKHPSRNEEPQANRYLSRSQTAPENIKKQFGERKIVFG